MQKVTSYDKKKLEEKKEKNFFFNSKILQLQAYIILLTDNSNTPDEFEQ